MQISRRTDALQEHMIVGLSGDIDLSAVANVRSAFHEVINDGWVTVLVDLSYVTFVDSAALGILVGLHRRCREKGGACVLVNPQPDVSRILSLTGLDVLLSIASNVETACAIAAQMSTDSDSVEPATTGPAT